MKTLIGVTLVSILTLGSVGARSADMTGDERSELRQRADELQNQRARNPGFEPGQGRLEPQRGEMRVDRNKGDVKSPSHARGKSPQTAKATKAKAPRAAKASKASKASKAKARKAGRSSKASKRAKARRAASVRQAKQAEQKRSIKDMPGALVR